MSYRCCMLIQNFALNFNGRIDTGKPCLSLCCEGLPDMPKIPFSETAEDTLRAFVGEGLLTAVECARVTDDSQRRFTAGCVRCAQFREDDWAINPLISYVNLSMYPSPCQSRCIYCGVHREDQCVTSEAAKRAVFYTNCIKFDEAVARNLHDNPDSAINLSIDAGTPQTWKRSRGGTISTRSWKTWRGIARRAPGRDRLQ